MRVTLKRTMLRGILIVHFVALSGTLCQGEPSLQTSDLLDKYVKAGAWCQKVSLQVHSEYRRETTGQGETEIIQDKINFTHRRDGSRAEWFGTQDWSKKGDESYRNVDSGGALWLLDGTGFIVARNEGTDRWGGGIGRIEYSQNLQSVLCDPRIGGFCNGFGITRRIAPGVHLGEFLKRFGTVQIVGQETIDGIPCHKLLASTPHGEITVWIAPDKGYNALRVSWISDDNDTVFPDGRLLKDSAIQECSLYVDSVEVQEIDGVFIPVSGCLTGVDKRRDGTTMTNSYKVTFTQIDLDPNFDSLGAFKVALPDGTRIGDMDSPGISYEVIGGKLQPYVDDLVVKAIDAEIAGMEKYRRDQSSVDSNDAVDSNTLPSEAPLREGISENNGPTKSQEPAGLPKEMMPILVGVAIAALVAVVAYVVLSKRREMRKG